MALGKVNKPKHVRKGHVLRVVWQSAKAGSRHGAGFKVSVTGK